MEFQYYPEVNMYGPDLYCPPHASVPMYVVSSTRARGAARAATSTVLYMYKRVVYPGSAWLLASGSRLTDIYVRSPGAGGTDEASQVV